MPVYTMYCSLVSWDYNCIIVYKLVPAVVMLSVVSFNTNIPGYYKRNRYFQCCIETKLLMF